MASAIPLIRSAALFPMIRWLRANGRPVPERLRAADLGYVSEDAPEVAIPLLAALEFFRIMGASEGPDIGARVVGPHSLADLGNLGRLVLTAHSPRDALQRAANALPRYCTHELLTLHRIPGGLRVRAGWSLVLDEVTMHLTQQFTATLIGALCAVARGGGTPRRVRIRPHPDSGVAHLRPWFGAALEPNAEAMLDVEIDDAVLDARLELGDAAGPPVDWAALKGDGSFGQSVRVVLAAMAGDPPGSIDRVARAAGLSTRSVQRALTSEGTSFRRLSDDLRRSRTLGALPADHGDLAAVASNLGYAGQSSLSRAVRRWTGGPPRALTHAADTGGEE